MNPVAFIADYLRWHYSTALLDILRVWGNLMWFVGHFFSTPLLIKTFFSAWKRMQEDYPAKGHFDPEYWIGSIVVNTIMRIVGMIVRAVFIVISLIALAFLLVGGVFFIVFWIVSPVAIFLMISTGIGLIAGA